MPIHDILDAVPDKGRPYLLGPAVWTYEAAAGASRKIAGWLQQNGVAPGDRVLIVATNCPEAILIAFAASRIGAIFSLINPAIRPHGLLEIVRQCRPSLVVLDRATLALRESLGVEAPICIIGEDHTRKDLPNISAALDCDVPEPMEPAPTDDAPACLIYTSGSTGAPCGVVLTHGNILFVTAAIQSRLGYRADDVVALVLPMAFDYGLYQFFLAAQAGATVAVGRDGAAGPELASFLDSAGATVLPGLPSLFANLIRLMDRRPQPLSRLRCLTNTGEHLTAAHIDRLQAHFPSASIFPMYGLTECKRVSILLPEELSDRPQSVGRPLDGTEARIVDEQGRSLPPDTIGELVVRGPHVAAGYWGAPAETALRFRTGEDGIRELHTGDLCRMDRKGFLYFAGRKDAQIKCRGYRMNPMEIEEAACRIQGVREVAVVKDAASGALCLYAVSSAPEQIILAGLREELECYKVPDQICLLDDLPKNANGKVDRRGLSDRMALPT